MKYLRRLKDEKAMTVAEIVVSVFILALIGAVILPGLLFGYQQVHESGKKSQKLHEVETSLEQELLSPGDDAIRPTPPLTIKFGDEEFIVNGKIVEKEVEYGTKGNKTNAKVFVPDP